MAKNTVWHDDYWLLLMQIYLHEPKGMKPAYSRVMINLSLELHIHPKELHARMEQLSRLSTPRLERIWQHYTNHPQQLKRAVGLLREMKGFGAENDFYEGVELKETFEQDFRPLDEDPELAPYMLVLILDLYFQLTPATMVEQTPEVREVAKLLRIDREKVVEVLDIYQMCDPYLNRNDITLSALLKPCQLMWQQYAALNDDNRRLTETAQDLKQNLR